MGGEKLAKIKSLEEEISNILAAQPVETGEHQGEAQVNEKVAALQTQIKEIVATLTPEERNEISMGGDKM